MENNGEIILKGRLNLNQKNRLAKLLDMMYSPSELANEIGFSKRQVYRVYLMLGCPYYKDETNHLWINGKLFRDWIKDIYRKISLKQNEVFCLTCKKAVPMVRKVKKQKDRLSFYQSKCPNCGRVLTRIITRGKLENDKS
jgi:hypothetical protein